MAYEKILEVSRQFLKIKNSPYKRYLLRKTTFSHRMSIIVGQRGVGKTTSLIQLLLEKVQGDRFDPGILYVQADHFARGALPLYEIAEKFQSLGGKWLGLDEIHKYPNWSQELKSIYDTFPSLKLFVSGSSALEIYKGTHDLIRRSVSYSMQGLSFREYLELAYQLELPCFSLEELCTHHEKLADSILTSLQKRGKKVLPEFHCYLKTGYYPYFFEIGDEEAYRITLEQNLHMSVEIDLVAIYPHLTGQSIKKIKQLLTFIAQAVPFIPNWQKMMGALEIGDIRTLKTYFNHLEDAGLIRSLSKATKKFSQLENPDKLYLENTNQLFAIASKYPEKGTVRETFFLSSLAVGHQVLLPKNGDFLVDNQFLFEVGGKNKAASQLHAHPNGYLACDEIEQGVERKIPLWLFGFLY